MSIMIVNDGKYGALLSEGLSLDHYYVLFCIGNKKQPPRHKRVQGFINLLHKKEYLEEGELTQKGKDLIAGLPIPNTDFPQQLLSKLRARMKEKTGKEQIMGFGGVYFIPSYVDMRDFLNRFNKQYKLLEGNEDKIEKILLAHVDRCADNQRWAPAVKYFIIKDKTGSPLADALENYEEPKDEPTYKTNIV